MKLRPPTSDVETATMRLEDIREVKQGLHQRHIQMISFAGTIDAGSPDNGGNTPGDILKG